MFKKSFFTQIVARVTTFTILFLGILVMLSTSISVPPVAAQEPTPGQEGSGRIVGGAPADPGEWPWHVALINGSASEFYFSQYCAGTLLSSQWVLTAAHCVVNINGVPISPTAVDVVVGIYNLSTPAAGYQRRDVYQIIVHPSFNANTHTNDIALLRLASPVVLGGSGASTTLPIPLVPDSIGDLAGTNSWVTGWGYTESSPAFPSELYEVSVPIITNAQCNTSYEGAITSNMLCAGLPEGGKDTCNGDSGGPLVVYLNDQWQLAGITSWGYGCADPGYYGVYTRVSSFTNWILANATVFADVPANHWAKDYIEALYLNGYTAGCSTSPLSYCPQTVMSRVESAVFMLRGNFGSTYTPPTVLGSFQDNWASGPWAQKWAQGLYDAGLTAGCNASPLLFCPWDQTPRVQLAVFGVRLKHGSSFVPPPATGTVFADLTDPDYFGTKWAEQAYADGLIPACGTSGGKPLFCPNSLVDRALAAFVVVEAKDLLP